MKTSIVILTFNKLEYTIKCVESIRKYTQKGTYEIIIVDNHSTDETVEWLMKQDDIKKVFNNENLGFPKGCNQGIEIATGENIMLLNNDVIVTKNWLENLVRHLYSSEDIGAVGPLTNSCIYNQSIKVNYKDNDEMQKFAEEKNNYKLELCEERLKLIGFCFLVKGEVLQKVGLLDEIFTPGNFEDDDLSLRIIKEGYKLLLCKDTFIHHYGGVTFDSNKKTTEYNNLIIRNREIFEKKWGVDIVHIMNVRNDIVSLITENSEKIFNVLQVECGGCGTLMEIKRKFKNANLYGIEKHEEALINKRLDANILLGDIENDELNYEFSFFDFIIIADMDIEIVKLINIINKIKKYLKDEGQIIITLPRNVNFINKFYELLPIEFDRNLIKHYDFKTQFVSKLTKKEAYGADKVKIKFILRRIENDIEEEESMKAIINMLQNNEITVDSIIEITLKDMIKKEEILNKIAVKCYESQCYDNVIPLLKKSLEINKNNLDTVYNLGYILYKFGEHKLALEYLSSFENVDKEVKKLAELVRGDVFEK